MILLAKMVIGIEVLSIIFAPLLLGKPKVGNYDFAWWISNLLESIIIIALSLRVIKKT